MKLADDLVFAPQTHGGKIYYHLEHPSRSRFYRVGYPEYVFLSLLDGTRTVAQALTITARMLGSQGLSQSRGIEVATWLLHHRLANFADGNSAWSLQHLETPAEPGGVFQRVNPFWMKYPFGSPDRLLSALLPIFGRCYSTVGTLTGFVIILVGAGLIISAWPKFIASAATVLTPHNWLWMFLAWLFLKVIHELSHGLACKFYGGEVRETGVIFILLAPMAYVDVTCCWRFPTKWHRIHVAAAGMFAELVIAAFAAIVWTQIDSSVAHHLLFNVIVMASLSTLLFNSNPLMRFDGYYILADLLEVPNLASEGSRFVRAKASRIFFGDAVQPLQLLGFRRWLVPCYGVAAAAWRLLVCISLVTAASVLFHGAGLWLGVLGVLCGLVVPLWKLGSDMRRRWDESRPTWVRAMVVATALTTMLAAVVLWVPWPGAMSVPVIVDYADLSVLRSRAPGFVSHVHVADGQAVVAGQLLVELSNDELEAELRELELAYEQGLIRQRVALEKRDGAQSQIVQRNLEAIEERLQETRQKSEALLLHAPLAGRVVARNLSQLVGRYVSEGDELLTVADEARKELVISVGQEEIDAMVPRIGRPLRFRIGARPVRSGRFDRLDPRASSVLPHAAMSAAVGGPLAVKPNETEGTSSMRLADPRFRGVITLTPDACRDLGAGEQGYGILGLRQESIGEVAWGRFYRWCESLLRPVRS